MKRIITSLRRHGRKAGAILGFSALLTFGFASPAFAAGFDVPPAGTDGQPTLVDIIVGVLTGSPDISWVDVVQLLIIPALPAIVGLINRLTPGNWPPLVKTIALGVVAVLSQVLPDAVQAANGGVVFDWLRAIISVGLTWYLAQKTYDKIYKAPIRSDEKVQTFKVLVTEPRVTTSKAKIAPAVGTISQSGTLIQPGADQAPPTTLSSIINGN